MVPENLIYGLVGAGLGFGLFLLNTVTLSGIYYRPDPNGKKVFTMQSLKDYLTAPFTFNKTHSQVLWLCLPGMDLQSKIKMAMLNWVIMSTAGALSLIGIRKMIAC